MKCEDVQLYITEHGIRNIPSDIKAHIAQCEDCLSFVSLYEEMERIEKMPVDIDITDIKKKAKQKHNKKKANLLSFAIAAMFLIIFGGYLFSSYIAEKREINKMRTEIDKVAEDVFCMDCEFDPFGD